MEKKLYNLKMKILESKGINDNLKRELSDEILQIEKQLAINYSQCGKNEVKKLCDFHDYDFYKYKGTQPRNKIARNLVDYEAGKTIFETALGIIRKQDIKQTELF